MNTRSTGFTLVEVIVSLVIVGVVTGAVAVSMRAPAPHPTTQNPARLVQARQTAVVTRTPVSISLDGHHLTFYPDGSVTLDDRAEHRSGWTADPWTGEVVYAEP